MGGAKQIASKVAVQCATRAAKVPRAPSLERWALAALAEIEVTGSVCIRVVDEAEMTQLNTQYRKRAGTTNVLSFAAGVELPDGDGTLLGDVVICAPVVKHEAHDQGKALADHFAHLVVHGVLHLCGFDHEVDADARVMEAREAAILRTLGIADPYQPATGTGDSIVHE